MGSKKTTTNTNQQYSNSYSYMTPPITAEMQDVLRTAREPLTPDPSIFHRFAAMKDDVIRSYDDPFGSATSPAVREKAQRSQLFKIDAERDKAFREDYANNRQAKFGQQLAAASLTTPNLVQIGGNSSGTQQTIQPSNILGSIIGGAATVGSAAL